VVTIPTYFQVLLHPLTCHPSRAFYVREGSALLKPSQPLRRPTKFVILAKRLDLFFAPTFGASGRAVESSQQPIQPLISSLRSSATSVSLRSAFLTSSPSSFHPHVSLPLFPSRAPRSSPRSPPYAYHAAPDPPPFLPSSASSLFPSSSAFP
jgi:hypothetical protein